MRKLKRSIARARMLAAGVGNVNKKMHLKDNDGVPNWRKALRPEGEKAQISQAQKIKRAKEFAHRKIRKVEKTA